MKKLKFIFTVLFLFTSSLEVSAHEDLCEIKRYGNVVVRIKSGYQYEEVNKGLIIAQLAEKLSKKLKYSNTIFLDFNHYYTGNCTTDYFISFDRGKVLGNQLENGMPEKEIIKQNSIVIRQVSSSFDPKNTLKMIEYAIENVNSIKDNQKLMVYKKNYCAWEIKAIEQKTITKIINSDVTKSITECLNTKIILNNKNGVSYYFKNNSFNLFYKSKNHKESEIISLKSIYYIKRINFDSQIIFETKNSFYYVHKTRISKKHQIPYPKIVYRPYMIEKKGKDKIALYYYYTVLTKNKDKPTKSIKKEYVYSIIKDKLIL